jgi:citrate lyase beta subunit
MSTLDSTKLAALRERLANANREVTARYPVDAGHRQPVHTVYGGAHLFKADLPAKLGKVALAALDQYGGAPAEFARAAGLTRDSKLAETIHARVVHKLKTEPVEDFRIDFEDGYGNRPDAEEDETARAAAAEVAKAMEANTLPPFLGIRIKPLSDELAGRSLRTLDLFVTELVGQTGGSLPNHFVITLPKITTPTHVEVLADALDALEDELGLERGAIPLELMIEVTQSLVGPDGQVVLPRLLDAARGRCVAAHFGTYDYTAACQITAAHQHMTHPACDFARHLMQVAYAGRGIWLSDGATNIMPVAPHRAAAGGALTEAQRAENRASVHAAWQLHVEHIRHSLICGYYQGWDLHPAQLPTRYGAVYAFFLEGLEAASTRLRNFVEQAAQATLVGDVFDDAATGQGLLNFFLRGVSCGAITEDEALATGLTLDELRSRSFVKVLENRRA